MVLDLVVVIVTSLKKLLVLYVVVLGFVYVLHAGLVEHILYINSLEL